MNANLTTLTTENLRELIDDTQESLDELRAELERRDERVQHHEIANLDNHMKSAELSLKTIHNFIRYLRESRGARDE